MRKLTDVFPPRYLKSYELGMAAGMLWVLGETFRMLVLDWLEQLQVDTATSRGLALFEAQFGITPMAADTLDDRRGRIKAKMRGAQTVTAAWIEAITDSYIDGASTATEIPREHHVDIEFNGAYGVPANIDSLTAALLESMPSHVLFAYQYRYLLVREVRSMGSTSPSTINTNEMLIFLVSEIECFGATTSSASGEGEPYPIFTDAASRVKYLSNGTGSVVESFSLHLQQ